MAIYPFDFSVIDPSWRECIEQGLAAMDARYLEALAQSSDWLPGPKKIFRAFSLPLDHVNYVLCGESPYPRAASANGYAFWDASIDTLWSETGLSKTLNRTTSLRNIMKMLLIAEGLLDKHNPKQEEIAKINKSPLVRTINALFNQFLHHGFLLLNATPVLWKDAPQKDARAWYPFTNQILDCLLKKRKRVKFILLGRIAKTLDQFIKHHPRLRPLYAEHPYNHSFITNTQILAFFTPLHLLRQKEQ